MQRTEVQNKALHLWFRQKSEQCRASGVSTQMTFEKTIELEMDEVFLKWMFKKVMERKFGNESTKDLDKAHQIDDIVEHLNRFFSENFNLPGIPIPSRDDILT